MPAYMYNVSSEDETCIHRVFGRAILSQDVVTPSAWSEEVLPFTTLFKEQLICPLLQEAFPSTPLSSETHHMLCNCHHPLDHTLLDYKSIPIADFVPVSLSSSTVRGSVAKKSTCNSGDIGDLGLIPGL